MSEILAIGSALLGLATVIGNIWLRKTPTPQQAEIQQDRKETDENKTAIDRFVDSGGDINSLRGSGAPDAKRRLP